MKSEYFCRRIVVLCFSIFILSSCSSSISHKKDIVSKPDLLIGKIYDLSADHAVLASPKAEIIRDFEKELHEKVEGVVKSKARSEGEWGAAFDIATNSSGFVNKVDGKSFRRLAKNLGIRDINVDARNNRTAQDLQVVILKVNKSNPSDPVFKVRVTNKVCAGSELWVSVDTLSHYGSPHTF